MFCIRNVRRLLKVDGSRLPARIRSMTSKVCMLNRAFVVFHLPFAVSCQHPRSLIRLCFESACSPRLESKGSDLQELDFVYFDHLKKEFLIPVSIKECGVCNAVKSDPSVSDLDCAICD